MSSKMRRNIYPTSNWKNFLEEGKREFDKLVVMKSTDAYGRDNFEYLHLLGKGAFGRVVLSVLKLDGKKFAIKILDKEKIVKKKQVKHALNEKRILQSLNHPFTVHLEYSFQDNIHLFLALPFVEGGEMYTHLRRMKKFPEEVSRFYAAQVLLAFEYLHYCDMIFRDLKPENILVGRNGYLKVTDFGFCKVVKTRTYTLCGTPEYLAPEIILSKGYGKAVDWWSFGVLLFEMTSGFAPFHAAEAIQIYEKVVACKYTVPKFFSAELKDLITNILQVDLSRRYGNLKGGISDIKMHEWFKAVDWILLFNSKVNPPFVPHFSDDGSDLEHFDSAKRITLSIRDSDPYEKIFEDF